MNIELSDLGLETGKVTECIVPTYSENGNPNAAPIGVHTLSKSDIAM